MCEGIMNTSLLAICAYSVSFGSVAAQAIARSHRIGQKKEVRVIHLEAVADAEQSSEPNGNQVIRFHQWKSPAKGNR